jgi:uncharacterized protein (TIGR03435 family)
VKAPRLTSLACFVLTATAFAQPPSQPQAALAFEVASVKPAPPNAPGPYVVPGPGAGLTITNMTLKELIVMAYRIHPFQVSAGPSWLDSARYDIVAKPQTKSKPMENMLMLQALLADRFRLAFHRETKELPVYAMVLARKDGKLGRGLTPVKEIGCMQVDASKPPSFPEPGKAPSLACGQMMRRPTRIDGHAALIANLIPMLSRLLGRTVVDKTGLTDRFDITLEWVPDDVGAALPALDTPKPPESPGPSIITAIREQLGIRLESLRGPVEIFVIDRAERPSEN